MTKLNLTCSCCGVKFILIWNDGTMPLVDTEIVCCEDCNDVTRDLLVSNVFAQPDIKKVNVYKYNINLTFYSHVNQMLIHSDISAEDCKIKLNRDISNDNLQTMFRKILRDIGFKSTTDSVEHQSHHITITNIIPDETSILIKLQTRRVVSLFNQCVNVVNSMSDLDQLPSHIYDYVVNRHPVVYLDKLLKI
jgi:hypothetical protein